jgi:ADP-ribose pyrophosphatase YjhB (NUDIX family)
MRKLSIWRRLASFLRRYPRLLLLPYYSYRLLQPKYSVGVVGVLLNEQGHVLLVEHVFHPRLPWGLPGGWIGRNEDPAHGVEREIIEELSIKVQATQVLLARRTQYNHLDIAFLCEVQDENATIGNLSYELLQYQWYAIEALPHLHRFHYDAIQVAHAKGSSSGSEFATEPEDN